MRLVQLSGRQGRRIAVVDESKLRLIEGFSSLYDLACAAIDSGQGVGALLSRAYSGKEIDYDQVYAGNSEWRILPSIDHPLEPARCLVTGTGLTHMASAKNRQAMHGKPEDLTDSMRMYRWGLEGGRPAEGQIGASPEWFYKGCGTILRG